MSDAAARSFPELLARNAQRFGDRAALRMKRRGIWRTTTWSALADESARLASALKARGVARGSRIAFIGENRPQLFAAIAAAQSVGATAMPLFPDATSEEIAEPLRDAEVTHVFAENQEQVDKLLEILPRCPALLSVIYDDDRSMGHYRQPQLTRYEDLLGEARAASRMGAPQIGPDDPAFLFYTAGAAGPGKGVILTHGALIGRGAAMARSERLGETDVTIAYLPPGWLCQTLFGYVLPLATGSCVCCPESSDTLLADMREVAPTVFLTTPRMLDTLVSQISLRMEDTGGLGLKLYRRATALAQSIGLAKLEGRTPPAGERLKAGLYDALVYGPLRDSLGLNRVKAAYSSGDAIDPSVLSFFRALGVNLKQLYGATETSFLVSVQRDGAVKPDTVGAPLDGVEVSISPEREILVRSPGLFSGYLNDPDATAAAYDAEEWFRTGDLGVMDADGQLRILDRKSDVGELAGGATFRPRQIENKIKFSPYIREAVAIGDGRDHVCALIDINTGAVGRWADHHELPYSGHADLASQDAVYGLVAEWLAEVNAALATEPELAACQIRRFALLQEELSPDDGALTRTGKIRRSVIGEKFGPVIDALYAGGDSISVASAESDGEAFGDGRAVIKLRDAKTVAAASGRKAA
jgi:long-chain acyl-CoA synthetase